MLRWYDWLLKGEANGVEKEKPVKIFVMGKNEWREEDDWPLARAKNTKYYLHSSGAANGIAPSGSPSVSGQAGGAGKATFNTAGAPGEEANLADYGFNEGEHMLWRVTSCPAGLVGEMARRLPPSDSAG